MAVVSYSDWQAACTAACSKGYFGGGWSNSAFGGQNSSPASVYSRFTRLDQSITPPGAAAVCTSTDAGALLKNPTFPVTTSKKLWIAEVEWGMGVQNTSASRNVALIHDRLCHMSGLDATLTTEQTTNLPTAPLTRYVNGEGVMLCIETYSATGTTASTGVVKYTNSQGVANRLSQPFVIGGSAGTYNAMMLMIPVSLQDGDTGVRSVESVTLAGSTATAGNFGVTLIKPLAFTPCDTSAQLERNPWKNLLFGGCIVEALPGACLSAMLFNQNSNTSQQVVVGRIGVVEA